MNVVIYTFCANDATNHQGVSTLSSMFIDVDVDIQYCTQKRKQWLRILHLVLFILLKIYMNWWSNLTLKWGRGGFPYLPLFFKKKKKKDSYFTELCSPRRKMIDMCAQKLMWPLFGMTRHTIANPLSWKISCCMKSICSV